MPNCKEWGPREWGAEAVIKSFRGKIVGKFAQTLLNNPLLQLSTRE